jgi:hypothetical protein
LWLPLRLVQLLLLHAKLCGSLSLLQLELLEGLRHCSCHTRSWLLAFTNSRPLPFQRWTAAAQVQCGENAGRKHVLLQSSGVRMINVHHEASSYLAAASIDLLMPAKIGSLGVLLLASLLVAGFEGDCCSHRA